MIGLDAVLLGGALLPLGFFGLYHSGAVSTSTLLLAFQVGLNLPHYFQTYSLTYLNPTVRRAQWPRLVATAAFAVAFPVTAILLGATALKWALAFIGFWAFLHITQQTRGLAGLYLRRSEGAALRRPLLAFLFLSTAAVVVWRVAGYGLTLAGDPLPTLRPLTLALAAASALALLFALPRVTRARFPALAITVLHTGALALSMSVPNLSLALALATTWHALQYLGLCFAVHQRLPEGMLLPRLAKNETVVFFGVAFAFALGAAGVGAALPPPWGQAIYLPLLLAHYLSDAWLWRPESNPELRAWLRPLAEAA